MIDHCTFESIKAKNWFIGICTIIDEKCIELDDWIHGWCEIKLDWECILKAILLLKKKRKSCVLLSKIVFPMLFDNRF
jgi:hypothetical protein